MNYSDLLDQELTSLRSKHFCEVGSKERPRTGFSVFCLRGKWGESQKRERGGWERGRKEMLADKPLDFENLRSPVNGVRDWLG